MRFLIFLIALVFSIAWIILLDRPIAGNPSIGKLLDPVSGCWANAEPAAGPLSERYRAGQTDNGSRIDFDDRLVPHIQAPNDKALYFEQGYLHARYRLWQMDMQTRAAAGRISEIMGSKTLEYDRRQRRKGMVWAAENSLKEMEDNPTTRMILDAYTRGVNYYIASLTYKDYPLEYKLMGFKPEPWTNLKCALLLKYMADDLTGSVDDIALSYLHDALPRTMLDDLFPEKTEGSQTVIPAGTAFAPASLPTPPVPYGEVFARFDTTAVQKGTASPTAAVFRSASGIGSNNWAVRGTGRASQLCNDPHLGLNLPSIWYELQLTAPGINCYGVSIPGAPGIIIGFNDNISWGVTNNYRDVKDYYEIKSEDPRLYLFDGKEVPFNERRELIGIKGAASVTDTVRYTIHGPVMYDRNFPEPSGSGKMLAMTWMAHRPTNELLSVYLYNRASDYESFVSGIQHFECPAQNFVYADRQGNVSMWGQGRFINKWKDQGKYVMRGDISATLWGDTIPMRENPHVLNPPQGYVASANQAVTDDTYPYWYNGDFAEFRSWEINRWLQDSTRRRAEQVQQLQLSNQSWLAGHIIPVLAAGPEGKAWTGWNGDLSPESKTATLFQVTWYYLYRNIWQDEFRNFPTQLYPSEERTMQLLIQDTASVYYDDVTTPGKEGLRDILSRSLKQAGDSLAVLAKEGGTEWYKAKNTAVLHLTKLGAFSYEHLKTGGWGNAVNAMKQHHGPSWRMVVSMDSTGVSAQVVYPGGQSGNPGSKHYADFLESWAGGRYFKARFVPKK